MTLIVSHISKQGIIQLSDSNLSTRIGTAGFGQKIFPVPYLNASVAFTGPYWVKNQRVDQWLNEVIDGSRLSSIRTIKEFVENLVVRLNQDMTTTEKEEPTILHIAGFEIKDFKSYAKHFHISNCSLKEGGSYGDVRETFGYQEDFNSENSQHRAGLNIAEGVNSPLIFANGEREGRTAFMTIWTHWTPLLGAFWVSADFKFRSPDSLFETGSVLKHYLEFVCHMYKMSEHEALYVGGEIQSHYILSPQDLDLSS